MFGFSISPPLVLALACLIIGILAAGWVTTSLMTHHADLGAWAGIGVAVLSAIIAVAVAATEPDW